MFPNRRIHTVMFRVASSPSEATVDIRAFGHNFTIFIEGTAPSRVA